MHEFLLLVTWVHAPYTNGFRERFHRKGSGEFLNVAFRQKPYLNVAESQADLGWLEQHSTARPRGDRPQGRTPLRAFTDGLTVSREEVPPAA